MMRPSVILFYLVPILIAAFLATLASASIGSLSGWGLPLQWKTGGCTIINGGLTCAAETDNWLFFTADVLLYSLAGYVLLSIGYRLAPSLVTRFAVLGPRTVLFSTLVATIITLATGLVLTTGQLVNPGGFSGESYGFPLAWKTTFASCPPPCIQANGTQYNWILLIGDLFFYLTASYGSLLLALRTPRKTEILRRLESRKVLGLLGLAVIVLSTGNYAFDSVYGTGNHWTGYGRLALDHYTFQSANLLTVWLKDYGPGSVTIATLYIIDPNGYGLTASYSPNLTLDSGTVGMITENTTSQGLQLTRNGSYNLKIITSQNVETTFSVTWT